MTGNRLVIITGAARRIGHACALELSAAGFDVLATVRCEDDDSMSLRQQIQRLGRRCLILPVDLQQVESVETIASTALDRFGRVDALVNNASLYEPDDTPEGPSVEQTRRLMRINYVIPHQLTMRLAAALRSTNGCVVNLLDVMAERPMPRYSGYCASKAALWNATLSLARRLAPQVRVNGVAPGMVGDVKPDVDDDATTYLRRVPLARAGTFDEAARLVRFLVNDATYLTGQVIRLDGGRSLGC